MGQGWPTDHFVKHDAEKNMTNLFDLTGKVAIVTGAAGGIGAAIAANLAGAGAKVLVADIDGSSADRVANEIGAAAMPARIDVTDPESVEAAFKRAHDAFGGIDILVCSAGISDTGTIFETPVEDWHKIIGVNLTGNFLCAKVAARYMRSAGRGGRLIFIGSPTGHRGALRGHVAYASSKGGTFAMAKTIARTLAEDGITSNVITPGQTDTELLWRTNPRDAIAEIMKTVPLGLAQPSDVAAGALYLASDAAGHVTGISLDIDGGGGGMNGL